MTNRVLLGEVVELRSGVGFPKKYQGGEAGGFPFAKVGDISAVARVGSREISSAGNYVSQEVASQLRAKPFPPGTVLFAKIGEAISQNFRVVAGVPILLDNNAMGAIPDLDQIDPRYLFQFMKATDLYRLSQSTTVPSLRKSELERIPIPLPGIEEQRRIAAVLDAADDLRTKRRQALAKLNTLTQAIFIDMFGDSLDAMTTGRCTALADVCSPFRNGAYFPKSRYVEDGGVEMVHMSDGFYGTVKRGSLKRVDVTSSEIEKYSLGESDLLVARRSLNFEGSVKPCRIPKCPEPLIFESSLIRVSPLAEAMTPGFLFALLSNQQYRQRHVYPFVTGATISGISQTNLKKLPTPCVTLARQAEFDTTVGEIAGSLARAKVSDQQLDTLFASLQQRAFAGEL